MKLLDDAQRYPITAILCIGALATFLAQETGRSVEHMVLYGDDIFTEPWRAFTTVFPHGGFIHVGFNVLWIWQLGRALESRLGTAWMLTLTLLTGVTGSAAELILNHYSIGLSGVVYGYVGYAWARGKREPARFGFINDSLRNFFVVWFFVCIGLTAIGALNVANAAHAGGAIIGLALGTGRPWMAPLIMTVIAVGVLVRGAPHRPPADALRYFDAALEAGSARDTEQALAHYQEAVRLDPKFAEAWFNIGIVHLQAGRMDASDAAFLKAYKLNSTLFDGDSAQGIRQRIQALTELVEDDRNPKKAPAESTSDGDTGP